MFTKNTLHLCYSIIIYKVFFLTLKAFAEAKSDGWQLEIIVSPLARPIETFKGICR